MEAKGSSSRPLAGGRDALRQHAWTNPNWRPELRSNYSSYNTSGTTTATSGTTPGCFTPHLSDDCPDPVLDLSWWWVEQDRDKKLDFIKGLFDEFCVADGDATVLERWLPEMGVDVSAASLLQFAGSWIRALTEIAEFTRKAYLTAMLSVPQQQPVHVHLARFAEALILKMTPFVDAIVAQYAGGGEVGIVVADGAPAPADKLRPLIGVRGAVSRASQDIRLSFCSTSSEMASLLSDKEAKLDEAIWSTMEEVRTRLLASAEDDDSPSWGTTQGTSSPDIHKVTRAIVSYIDLLSNHCPTLHQIHHQAAQLRNDAPRTQIDSITPLANLMTETVSSLEQKLAEKSRSFPDQSMRFLFLINNSHFIWQQLYPTAASILEPHMSGLARKVDNYIETYLEMAWEPVLSCLCNSTPLCLGRCSSPAKFEAEFQKTYDCQKLWKVPDPKLRRRIRVAVIEKVVSNFSKYLEYNNISPSRITPQYLMDMLQELFEG